MRLNFVRSLPAILAVAVVSASLPLGALSAQTPAESCPAGTTNSSGNPDANMASQDACYKAIDLFHFMAPQLGVILSGGRAIQNTAGTLGGLGHFSIGVRVNGINGDLPQADKITPSIHGARQDTYEVEQIVLGAPLADVSLGVFKGFGVGSLRMGAVDVMASLSYLPDYDGTSVTVHTNNSHWGKGYGARVGLIEASPIWPAVSVSYIGRKLPVTDITASTGEDRLALNGISAQTRSWRLVASKKLAFIGLAAGAGKDRYETDANISVHVAARGAVPTVDKGPIALTQKLDRNNVFGSAWIGGNIFHIVGEVGLSSGGHVETFNQFADKDAARSRQYFSIGIGIGH